MYDDCSTVCVPVDNGAKIAKDTVIDVWKGGNWQVCASTWTLLQGVMIELQHLMKVCFAYQEEMEKVTSAGFHTVLSAPFYLNYISYGTLRCSH